MSGLLLTMALTLTSSGHRELTACLRHCRAAEIRPYSRFCVEEIVIPEGRHRGERFRHDVQPWTRLLHAAIDEGRYNRFAVTGTIQGGKSLNGYVFPCLYHLFETVEPVVLGAPTMDICRDKFRKEIEPCILARRKWREMMPESGPGSRGGFAEEIVFRNGARLKFIPAGGGDEKRSSYTARVIVQTEVDKMDRPGAQSRETSPVRQIEGRAESYDDREKRVYLECTVSIPGGCIWQEVTVTGTNSRIAVQCPHCLRWVTPEREHLHGWQQAENAFEARELAFWICPHCAAIWEGGDGLRRQMNERAILVHQGQSIDTSGTITGEPKRTDTLGFRVNAYNNLFWSTAKIAAGEWEARRSIDEDSAERERRQFIWVIPYKPPAMAITPLDPDALRRRKLRRLTRGLVPPDAERMTLGLDIGKWVAYWLLIAWRPGARGHVLDYGTIDVPSRSFPTEKAIRLALDEFRETVEQTGWLAPDGSRRVPDQVWVDARYQGGIRNAWPIYEFCREAGQRWLPSQGHGTGRHYPARYHAPIEVGGKCVLLGDEYHVDWEPEQAVFVAKVNADTWKTRLHERLALRYDVEDAEVPEGAITLYDAPDANEHLTLIKHLTAEEPVEEFLPERGRVVLWRQHRAANHYLDCAYLATAAGHLCGVRFTRRRAAPETPEPPGATIPLGPGWRPEISDFYRR